MVAAQWRATPKAREKPLLPKKKKKKLQKSCSRKVTYMSGRPRRRIENLKYPKPF